MSAADAQTLHVLLADDDRLVLASLTRGLRDAGFRVSPAGSGEEALEIADRDAPDLALLDMRMPGIDGIELGKRLRGRVPFLYLSAYGDEATVREAIDQGALGYLVKPLEVSQILPMLSAAVARAAEMRTLAESESKLESALHGARDTAMAVGVLMERNRVDRGMAFEHIRAQARASRRSLQDVAREIVGAAEKMNINK